MMHIWNGLSSMTWDNENTNSTTNNTNVTGLIINTTRHHHIYILILFLSNTPDPPRKRQVFRHERHAPRVDRAQVRVFEEPHKQRLARLLAGVLGLYVAEIVGLVSVRAVGGEGGLLVMQFVVGLVWSTIAYRFFHAR